LSGLLCYIWGEANTTSLSSANFVGYVVGFLNVLEIRLRSLLLAASLSFESEVVLAQMY
jgi:hypothetical protein